MSGYMSSCVQQHLPPHVDLVLLEYAANDRPVPVFNMGGDDRRALERLMRKLLRLPSRPAVVLVNMFAYHASHGRYWQTPERDFMELATYYSLPAVSLRAAVMPSVLIARDAPDGGGISGALSLGGIFNGGKHHPGRGGHVVVAELLITLVQELLHANKRLATAVAAGPAAAAALLHGGDSSGDAASTATSAAADGGLAPGMAAALQLLASVAARPLPPPLSEGNYESANSTCYIEHGLLEVVQQPAVGWEWTDEGRQKWGWVAVQPEQQLRIKVSTVLAGARDKRASRDKVVLQVAYLQSYGGMGAARVACESGCECEGSSIDSFDARPVSVTAMYDLQVTQHPACVLSVATTGPGSDAPGGRARLVGPDGGGDGGESEASTSTRRGSKFKLLGVVVGEEPGAKAGSVNWLRDESHSLAQSMRNFKHG